MWHILKPHLRHPLMPVLMLLQVALACAITCNIIFLLQQKLGPVFAQDGVGSPRSLVFLHGYVARGTPFSAARLREVRTELQSIPGVAGVSFATSLPMVPGFLMNADILGTSSTRSANADIYFGDKLVRELGLQLVAGRDFTPDEEDVTVGSDMGFHHTGPVIVTRALAERLYPSGSALGKIIRYEGSPGGERTIVGVVAHLIRNEFGKGNSALEYSMLFPGVPDRWPLPLFAVRLSTSDTGHVCKALIAAVRHDLGADVLPGYAERCDPYSLMRDQALAPERASVWLLSGVALIVLVVTLTGIMGMAGYWVQQRTRSIGIRRALGARRSDVLRELLIENMLIVGTGIVVGMIAAYGISLWLMQHYELLRLPWIYLPIGAGLLLLLGQLAVLRPSLKASRIPPVAAIRAI